jgi:transposase
MSASPDHERGDAHCVRRAIRATKWPVTPLLVERPRGETQLFVKEVKVGSARDIQCRNEAEAERDRSERQAILAGLSKQLARGDKALIGNSAYRLYLRRTASGNGKPGPAFEIDPGKLADEARYDGLFVLRTNARITPLQAVLRYRDLLQVEDLFRRAKAILRTRPIYHSCDAAIRGHVFCSFLALMLQKELADLLRDLDHLQEATIEKDGKRITTRTAVAGQVGNVFQAAGIALPPNRHERTA